VKEKVWMYLQAQAQAHCCSKIKMKQLSDINTAQYCNMILFISDW
jgi:hypothetical protein